MVNLKGKPVELRVPSRMGYEKVAMGTAASVAKLMGFPDDRIEDLKTGIAEACINAIEYGTQLNENLSVGVTLSSHDDSLEVKVLDNGGGISRVPPKPDIDRKVHGEEDARGMVMILIHAPEDEAEWLKDNAAGSYVRLVIRLDKENE